MTNTGRNKHNHKESSESNGPAEVSRRGFIKAAIVAGAGTLAAGAGCGDQEALGAATGGGGAGTSGASGKAGSAGTAGTSGGNGTAGQAGSAGHAGAAGGGGAAGASGSCSTTEACNHLQHTISFSNTTPVLNERVTCVVKVTNTGTTTEGFHITFSQQGLSPFHTSPANIIVPGETRTVSTEFECSTGGTIGICVDLACDPVLSAGVQRYPADHYWNAPVDTLPVHPLSSTYISSCSGECTTGYCHISVSKSEVLNYADASTPKRRLTSITSLYKSDDIPYPIPEGAISHWGGGADPEGSLFIINWEEGKFYEMYKPIMAEDGSWSAKVAIAYDFSSYVLRPDNLSSISASGMPQIPGYIRYEEVAAGEINHAICTHMFTTQASHIWAARTGGVLDAGDLNPASTHMICDDTEHVVRDWLKYPPLGQRFRLKASYDISGFPPHEQVILRAMKKYGLVVTDQNCSRGVWTIKAFDDPRWDIVRINYHHFDPLRVSDFEAVDMSSLMIDKDSGQCRTP
jgi:hypothetical protein